MAEADNIFTVLDVQEIPFEFPDGHPLSQVLALWHEWADGRPAPTWRDIELYRFPALVLPQTLVVDVVDGGADYRYRFWGTGYTEHYGVDETGLLLGETVGPSFVQATFDQLGRVLETGTPRTFDVTIRAPKSGLVQSKLNLRLPIMDEPGTVTKIVTATLFDRASGRQVDDLREAFGDDMSLATG